MEMIREATRQFRIQQWMDIIHDRSDSGMTVVEYCKQKGLSRNAYFYWAKIIKEQALKEQMPDQRFVELPAVSYRERMTETSSGSRVDTGTASLVINIKGISITVTESTTPVLLARTLEVIKDVT